MTGLLERARRAAGLSQTELAHRAATSRPTLSAYEHGRKIPSLETALRLLRAAEHDLELVRLVTFHDVPGRAGRVVSVPDSLPRLPLHQAFADIALPLHLDWSGPSRTFDLANRHDRARVYEIVLAEGRPEDVLAYVDGALLVDLWHELVLPRSVRTAWDSVITARR